MNFTERTNTLKSLPWVFSQTFPATSYGTLCHKYTNVYYFPAFCRTSQRTLIRPKRSDGFLFLNIARMGIILGHFDKLHRVHSLVRITPIVLFLNMSINFTGQTNTSKLLQWVFKYVDAPYRARINVRIAQLGIDI